MAGYSWLQNETLLRNAIKLTKEYNLYNCPTLDWDIMANNLQYPDAYKERLTNGLLPSKFIKSWETNYEKEIEKAGGRDKVVANKNDSKQAFENKQDILKMLSDNGCLLLIGGDAGNNFQADGFNVYEEMVNWSKAGIDNYTILKSATLTPAMFFNQSDKWGTIEIGKDADMVILEKNPLDKIENIGTIETTIIDGKIFKRKDLLEKL